MGPRGGGGGKSRRRRPRPRGQAPARDDEQRYARVTALLGNGRVTALCDDGALRRCKIRGSMRRREWVRVGDTVLVALRTELSASSVRQAEDVGDVVWRYEPAELDALARRGERVRIASDDADEAELEQLVAFDAGADDDDDGTTASASDESSAGSMDWEAI